MLVLGVLFIVFLLALLQTHERPRWRRRGELDTTPMMVLEDGVLFHEDLVPPDERTSTVLSHGLTWAVVPFSGVRSARMTPDGWVLRHRHEGKILHVNLTPDILERLKTDLLEDFEQAWSAWKETAPPENAALFEPGVGEDIETWFGRCRALGGRAATDYRGAALPVESIWRIVESPAARPLARVGAVFALGFELPIGGAEYGTGRLRRAGNASSSPHLRAICSAQRWGSTEEDVVRWGMRELCTRAKSAYDTWQCG